MKTGIIYGAVLALLPGWVLLPAQEQEPAGLDQAKERDMIFLSRFFPSERGKISDRLTVRLQGDEQDPATGIELLITDETYYNRRERVFEQREVAYITGPGLGSRGLFFVTEDTANVEAFAALLGDFVARQDRFVKNEAAISRLEEDWLGDGISTFDTSIRFGQFHLAGRRLPSDVTMNWKFQPPRVWLSFDDFININNQIAPVVLALVQHIPRFSEERSSLRQALEEKRDEIVHLTEKNG